MEKNRFNVAARMCFFVILGVLLVSFLAVLLHSAIIRVKLPVIMGELSVDSAVAAPEISAKHAVLIDSGEMEILYEKNARDKAYPASTTKIMTALVTLETLEFYDSPLEQLIVVPAEAVNVEGSSIYLAAGEEISIEDLLYGAMLRSGNDAAMCLAQIIGGSTENFVAMMNEKANALGCTGTNFTNPSGLFDENHYTTAYDLALISAASMDNPNFRELSAAKEYRTRRPSSDYNFFYNKNKALHQYSGATGIKIGYTKAAGRTLVASAKHGDTELICVVLNAPNWFNDAYALLDYGFTIMQKK